MAEISTNIIKRTQSKWLFDVAKLYDPRSHEMRYTRFKNFLYHKMRRSLTQHDLKECYQLLKVLPKVTTMDPYILFRFVMILIESNRTEVVNKNVIIYMESLLSKLDFARPDVFIEYLSYFIRHNRLEDARELFDQRHRFMTHLTHRPLPFVDINLRCYEFLLNYLKWDNQVSSRNLKSNFDVSIQGWVVNAVDRLKTTTSNHEYYIMCVVRVLLYYGYSKKSYLILSEFQRNNPENITANLMLIHLIDRLGFMSAIQGTETERSGKVTLSNSDPAARDENRARDVKYINNFSPISDDEIFQADRYPIDCDTKDVMTNLHYLDPSNHELLRLVDSHDNLIESLLYVMDGLEIISEIKNIDRWQKLFNILENILESGDRVLVADAQFLWQTRYRKLWQNVDFIEMAGTQNTDGYELIQKVMDLLKDNLNRRISLD